VCVCVCVCVCELGFSTKPILFIQTTFLKFASLLINFLDLISMMATNQRQENKQIQLLKTILA
jgi:hypothetical protein